MRAAIAVAAGWALQTGVNSLPAGRRRVSDKLCGQLDILHTLLHHHPVEPALVHHLQDAYQYQNIFGPLVKMEADHDKAMREGQVTAAPARHSLHLIVVCVCVGCSPRTVVALVRLPESHSSMLSIALGCLCSFGHLCTATGTLQDVKR